ncbi:MAG: 1-deoxy-D-xylulose-5-phosphate reductoisomerase [Peptococcaceae bacterium]|nr:1-deoxy-D-xylulose-5-phosphate reductoisomerase [Peptococcaceae bacterium]
MKHLAILGSTGSIGTQTLEVVDALGTYQVDILSAHRNKDLLYQQVMKYRPKHVFITDSTTYEYFKGVQQETPFCRYHYLWHDYASCLSDIDCVIGAITGAAGIEPVLDSLRAGLRIGLANKETMVEAGDIVLALLKQYHGEIIPVDSEHSAIFQCLEGRPDEVAKIILTASGGPFRTWETERFASITKADALKHPNWSMGAKITIDSATMVNKGLEVIEAHYLFNCDYDRIQVVVHPESIVHSMVQFTDGAIKAQLGLPDMRLPIQLAMTYPARVATGFEALDVWEMGTLHFEKPRFDVFPGITMAYECGKQGGSAPIVMNACNEVVVAAFLEDRIRFVDIVPTVMECVARTPWQKVETLDQIHAIDAEARALAADLIKG